MLTVAQAVWITNLNTYSDTASSHKESLDVLRGNGDFVHYVTSVALQKVEQMSDKGTCDGSASLDKSKVVRQIYTLARWVNRTAQQDEKLDEPQVLVI